VAEAALDSPALEIPPWLNLKLKLRVITRQVTPTHAPGTPFLVFASALVSMAIFALVVLHVMVDQASFRVGTLNSKVAAQQVSLRQLRYAESVQEAPGRLAAAAAQLGMGPAGQVQTVVAPVAASTPTATATGSSPPPTSGAPGR
jgi:hypothetical protein